MKLKWSPLLATLLVVVGVFIQSPTSNCFQLMKIHLCPDPTVMLVREYSIRSCRWKRIVVCGGHVPGIISGAAVSRYQMWLYLSICLLSCGDVHPIPGPIKSPCSICARPVKSNQKAIKCDGCNQWSHCSCNRVGVSMYRSIQVGEVSDWLCNRCLLGHLRFHECSFLNEVDISESSSQDSQLMDGIDQPLFSIYH